MPDFTYPLGGGVAHVSVPDELGPYYRAQPGYTEVVPAGPDAWRPADPETAARELEAQRAELQEQAASLAGAELDAAVKAAKVAHPSSLSADEKRAAWVDAQLAGVQDADPDPAVAGNPEEN